MWADDVRERVRRAGRVNGAGLAVPVPLEQAAAVIENITAKQLRVIVSTRWEAAWALIDIPGR